jgi:hypothetical protein
MKSPYRNPWNRNPYANAKADSAKAEAARRRQSLMMNVAIWGAVPATVIMIATALISH